MRAVIVVVLPEPADANILILFDKSQFTIEYCCSFSVIDVCLKCNVCVFELKRFSLSSCQILKIVFRNTIFSQSSVNQRLIKTSVWI